MRIATEVLMLVQLKETDTEKNDKLYFLLNKIIALTLYVTVFVLYNPTTFFESLNFVLHSFDQILKEVLSTRVDVCIKIMEQSKTLQRELHCMLSLKSLEILPVTKRKIEHIETFVP